MAGQGKALLELRRPSPPTPARPQAGSPQPIQRLGPRQGRAASGLEHQRAPGRPLGRVEEPALLPQGAALRAPGRDALEAAGLPEDCGAPPGGPTSPRAPPPTAVT